MASQQSHARSRRLAVVVGVVAASTALASGPVFAASDPVHPSTTAAAVRPAIPKFAIPKSVTPKSVTPRSAAPRSAARNPGPRQAGKDVPAFGAYLDYGALGVARIAGFSNWLGGAEVRVGHTYLPGDMWSNIEGDVGFLGAWADWRRQKSDRILVLNVPMLEHNEAGVPDEQVRLLLRDGAAGQFDHHFRALAERLVALKVPDTVIVLGWEMNGTTYTHRCAPDPEAWKQYWNRIVTTMRSVPGQRFRFDFTPSRGLDAVPWTRCYPGDATVDIVGMDSYDQPSGRSFDEQVKEPYGLQEHVDFARAHGKPISYPEWGLFRNGDNTAYMRRMLAWIDEHRPVYNTLTDYCPHGVWQCSGNPESSAAYRALVASPAAQTAPAGPTTPVTSVTPATPTMPTVPTVPSAELPAPETGADCMPLELGDWVEYWIGGKICTRIVGLPRD
ncbi:glycosyl hydrolase [Streptomyces sp. NPDC059766]|uniref:glycoside hydrolase family 26 protein n=1 Tax=Streptomyces sp. NPDC059766 TaxID=3346940 RepID=UPI00365FB300